MIRLPGSGKIQDELEIPAGKHFFHQAGSFCRVRGFLYQKADQSLMCADKRDGGCGVIPAQAVGPADFGFLVVDEI